MNDPGPQALSLFIWPSQQVVLYTEKHTINNQQLSNLSVVEEASSQTSLYEIMHTLDQTSHSYGVDVP